MPAVTCTWSRSWPTGSSPPPSPGAPDARSVTWPTRMRWWCPRCCSLNSAVPATSSRVGSGRGLAGEVADDVQELADPVPVAGERGLAGLGQDPQRLVRPGHLVIGEVDQLAQAQQLEEDRVAVRAGQRARELGVDLAELLGPLRRPVAVVREQGAELAGREQVAEEQPHHHVVPEVRPRDGPLQPSLQLGATCGRRGENTFV